MSKSKYQEILKLAKLLEADNIPFELIKRGDGYQILLFDDEGMVIISVIEFYASYGHEEDLLEIMGLLTPEELEYDTVKGWLSAKQVFRRIKKYYEEGDNGQFIRANW